MSNQQRSYEFNIQCHKSNFKSSKICIYFHSVPTTNTERIISLISGGVKPNAYEKNPNLLTFQGMKSAEAFGSTEEMNITDS